MTPDRLKTILSSSYDIVCFENLSDYINRHSDLFEFFRNQYQTQFLDQQRLIFYTACDIDQTLCDHLQRSIQSNNIGNFFVLICSTTDLTHKLSVARDKFNPGDVTIDNQVFDLQCDHSSQANRYLQQVDNICALPYASLSIFNNQAVPCCKFESGPIDHIASTSLNEIFNGHRMQQIRTDMFRGKKLKECQTCWNHEATHNSSLRKYYLEKYQGQLDHKLLDDPQLIELQIAPSTVCNFVCRICNSMTSSRIAAEELNHAPTAEHAQSIQNIIRLSSAQSRQANNLLLDNVADTFANITTLRLVGGEPFLWYNLEKFLHSLIEHNYAQNIRLEFNTNGSVYSDSVMALIQQFREVEILISIDAVGQRFEIQRGGNWSTVNENVARFSQLRNHSFIVKLCPTVNIQNVLYLDEVIDYAQQWQYEIVWWYLENPDYLCIDHVTQLAKTLIVNKYQNHELAEFRNIAARVHAKKPVCGKRFIDHMHKLDQRRAQNFEQSHTEIYQAMLSL